jgi:hypothetical protein
VTDAERIALWSHIGNIIRLTTLVSVREATDARDAAESQALHALLLDPLHVPGTQDENLVNYRLLKAFAIFRTEIEGLRSIDFTD